jgi:HEAT repeat protein
MTSPAIVYSSIAITTTDARPAAVASNVTHRGIASLLLGIRGGYCQAMFEDLASQSPDELLEIVLENRAPVGRLTYAAEILGREIPTGQAASALAQVLRDHPSPLVREGAILGLAHHLQRIGVREAIERAAHDDPSPGVRRAALEALED